MATEIIRPSPAKVIPSIAPRVTYSVDWLPDDYQAHRYTISVNTGDLVQLQVPSPIWDKHGSRVFKAEDVDTSIVDERGGRTGMDSHGDPGYMITRIANDSGTLQLVGVPEMAVIDVIRSGDGNASGVDVSVSHGDTPNVGKGAIIVTRDEDDHAWNEIIRWDDPGTSAEINNIMNEGTDICDRDGWCPLRRWGYYRSFGQVEKSGDVAMSGLGGVQGSIFDMRLEIWKPDPKDPPRAIMDASPTSGDEYLTVDFDGSDSYDPDGNIQKYIWDLDDNHTVTSTENDFTLEQTSSGLSTTVTPLQKAESLESYYNYYNAESHEDPSITTYETTTIFLYQDTSTGKLGLGIINSDGSGSATDFSNEVELSFSGIPSSANIVVEDDPGETEYRLNQMLNWKYHDTKTDGVAFDDLTQPFEITIDPNFISGITDWRVAYGDINSPSFVNISDLNEPITIKTQSTTPGQISHTYSAGTYRPSLKVVDNDGLSDTDYTTISVDELERPSARFNATPKGGEVPLEVDFDASASHDPDGSIVQYEWNFGDGSGGYGEAVTHEYDGAGVYYPELTVKDNDGLTDSISNEISVVDPIEPSPDPPRSFTLSGSANPTNDLTNQLNWIYRAKNVKPQGFNLYKGRKGGKKEFLAHIDGNEYEDTNVTTGVEYEYKIVGQGYWKSEADFSQAISSFNATKGDIVLIYEDESLNSTDGSNSLKARLLGQNDAHLKIYVITENGEFSVNNDTDIEVIRTGSYGVELNNSPNITTSKLNGSVGEITPVNEGSIVIQWASDAGAINERCWSYSDEIDFLYDEYPEEDNDIDVYRRVDQTIEGGTLTRNQSGYTQITVLDLDYSETPLRIVESSTQDIVTARPSMVEIDVR